jgi:hypothetical protein
MARDKLWNEARIAAIATNCNFSTVTCSTVAMIAAVVAIVAAAIVELVEVPVRGGPGTSKVW